MIPELNRDRSDLIGDQVGTGEDQLLVDHDSTPRRRLFATEEGWSFNEDASHGLLGSLEELTKRAIEALQKWALGIFLSEDCGGTREDPKSEQEGDKNTMGHGNLRLGSLENGKEESTIITTRSVGEIGDSWLFSRPSGCFDVLYGFDAGSVGPESLL
jgi:hypothetical protein